VGKVNWTIVAISAGISLGAGVAVLSTSAPAPQAGGLVVPQSGPVEEPVRPPVRLGESDPLTPVPTPAVVTVTPATYSQALTPRSTLARSNGPATIARTIRQTSPVVRQALSAVSRSSSWSGWFATRPVSTHPAGTHPTGTHPISIHSTRSHPTSSHSVSSRQTSTHSFGASQSSTARSTYGKHSAGKYGAGRQSAAKHSAGNHSGRDGGGRHRAGGGARHGR
jgi:hypothetical protein